VSATTELERLIEPMLESMGFELVGVEYLPQGRSGLLRVYIDKPGSSDHDGALVGGAGVTIDDCSRVSYQLSGLLDVEDPIAGKYVLEVSSPGLDRPLFRRRDFERFVGRAIKVRMTCPVAGRRKFDGELLAVDGDDLVLQVAEVAYRLALSEVRQARLVAVV